MLQMLTVDNSCAQRTLAAAMVTFNMAPNLDDAYQQIHSNPGADLADIETSVVKGLTSLSYQLDIPIGMLINEDDLSPLANVSATQIVQALHIIHSQWIEDNFNAHGWVEKYFNGQLGKYRKTSRIAFDDVVEHLLFIQEYLNSGGCTVSLKDVQEAFFAYCHADDGDADLFEIEEIAWSFKGEIIKEIMKFREKSSAKPELVERIDTFLAEHSNPSEVIADTLKFI